MTRAEYTEQVAIRAEYGWWRNALSGLLLLWLAGLARRVGYWRWVRIASAALLRYDATKLIADRVAAPERGREEGA